MRKLNIQKIKKALIITMMIEGKKAGGIEYRKQLNKMIKRSNKKRKNCNCTIKSHHQQY